MAEMHFFLCLVALKVFSVGADNSVHILGENLEQCMTSSTLEWVPSNGNNEALLKNAVVATYQTVKEPQNEPGEEGEQDTSEESSKPVYVCRAKINGVWVSGQLRPNKSVCIASLYKIVSENKQFDILVSIEGSSRLSWLDKNKYTLISQGAVTSGSGNDHKSYVARRLAHSHNREGSLTHTVGKFNPSENLGVFNLVDQNNVDLQFEDGQILVETEPVRYEFKSLKFMKIGSRYPRSRKFLGRATLKNDEDELQHIASVISYSYNYSSYWGKCHGLLTGLPFKVAFQNGTQLEGKWAIPKEEEKSEVAQISKYLEAGTAVNVTLFGNYTESEVPYTATVVAIYEDGEKREITIKDTLRENKMLDVETYYGPVYFLHNNSHVPTTTTTVASTTRIASTTYRTTSTAREAAPIVSPADVSTTYKTVDKPAEPNHENDNNMPNDDNAQRYNNPSTKKPGASTEPDGASSLGAFSLATILLGSLVILRVT